MRFAKRNGQKALSIVNTLESTIERESDLTLRTLAGPEIGVASTKAFTCQLAVLACLTLALANMRNSLPPDRLNDLASKLRLLPGLMATTLTRLEESVPAIAKTLIDAKSMLFIGRGRLYPMACEGALKMKEISYIHAEAYAAGELKHGPIALIDEDMPLIAVAPGNDPLFEKMASNIQENAARGARIILISDAAGAAKLANITEAAIVLPDVDPVWSPLLYALPLQLLAYHVATIKGTDVDMPRNLAKSVTVE
jgi:glucosamine--fructose-6-phosphate aminotransferase (isomerizing)